MRLGEVNEAVPAVRAVGLTLDRFEDFYLAQWNRVYRPLALSLRDPDLAAEAVDEAMTRAYQRWQVVRRYENPTGWVYRVALNWARSRLRRRSREHTGLPSDRGYEHDVPDPEVHRAIAALPDHQRDVVVLRFLFDWSEKAIAAALRIPSGTVKSRLSRALARLREELEP